MNKSKVLVIVAATVCSMTIAGSARSQSVHDKTTDPEAIKDASANQPERNGEAGRIASPPIHGWHPIKRALQPVENLEKNGVQLEQQIMKMEAPIKDLHPPMVRLQDRATAVSGGMAKMQGQMGTVTGQMSGVRGDLAKLKKDIAEIKGPVVAVRKPLEEIAGPIEAVKKQLNMVLAAIIFAGFAICLGTPLVAILMYRFRDRLFPADVAQAAESHMDNAGDDDDITEPASEPELATAGG